MKTIKDLMVGELFSFTKKGAVHMITKIGQSHFEYKSYADGKIRVCFHINKILFIRKDYDLLFEKKWFKL